MPNSILEVKILDLEICQTLFELLSENINCISEPLKSKIYQWVECENKGWVIWSDICPNFINKESCVVMLNGKSVKNVTGYNQILRKVTVMNEGWQMLEVVRADSFSINNIDFDNFVEW
jgi:hypothetical protein